ncbi:tyrosine-type recombinase/integrase [Desulfopila aestuarii]|uniref:Phage integrase, N-terminal SAM-like domain n=1 Tax=Desulfopila aestuarii DSM 18488 TaxID=1121416 RepID=A0A1M7YF82_9BACT|nr:tyrosine-type recombinase/integrase [Desulfopila aestuarii]SHO51280.1 Phage integrase, N-terminal SAM-like domain [Desulfopila aestuarii DSM 18488]
MTEVISTTKFTAFAQGFFSSGHIEVQHVDPGNPRSFQKRYWAQLSCTRLIASRLPGADLAAEYMYDKYIRDLSTKTIQSSGRVILYFLHFLERKKTNIYTLTHQDISQFVGYEQERGQKTQSVVNYLRIVYAFIKYLVDQDVLPDTVMERKIRIKLPEALPRAITPEDQQRLLGAIRLDRDRALILLLLRTGMRIGELLEVQVSDISVAERKIMIYLGEKNFQGRAVYYSEDAELALKKWLKIRPGYSTSLFPGRSAGRSISYVTAWSVMQNILDRAGLSDKGYSLHSLRHTFATDMLNAGMRLEVLQQLLGHQEIEMTMRYAKITDLTREHEYFKAIARIEQGGYYEHRRVNTQLQRVFEKKKLLRSKRK